MPPPFCTLAAYGLSNLAYVWDRLVARTLVSAASRLLGTPCLQHWDRPPRHECRGGRQKCLRHKTATVSDIVRAVPRPPLKHKAERTSIARRLGFANRPLAKTVFRCGVGISHGQVPADRLLCKARPAYLNRLFRNGCDGTSEDVTAGSGLALLPERENRQGHATSADNENTHRGNG